MGGQFLIDAIAQGFECVPQLVEKVCPKRGYLTVRFACLCLQGCIGKGRKDVFETTSDHDNQVDHAKIEILKDAITVRVDRNTLEWSILLTLHIWL